ncbi:MAG TPA: hypothetical protein VN107_05520 [Microbacterium sp.]|nr:hypothetical protein [Microbacterium sp.]
MSEVIDGLEAGRSRAARAHAEQLVLFAELIPIVQARREERAAAHANPRHQKVSPADREVVADVAAALQVSERTVHSRISRARELTVVFPQDAVRADYAAAAVAAAQHEAPPRLSPDSPD